VKKGSKHSDEKSNDNKQATKENNDKMQREKQRKARTAKRNNKAVFLRYGESTNEVR